MTSEIALSSAMFAIGWDIEDTCRNMTQSNVKSVASGPILINVNSAKGQSHG